MTKFFFDELTTKNWRNCLMLLRTLVCAGLTIATYATTVLAQQPAAQPAPQSAPQSTPQSAPMTQGASNIKRTPLQKFDVAGTNLETVIGIAEIVPNAMIGAHSHSGVESGYMLEGEMVLMITGQPDKTLKAGDSYQIPAGVVHDGKSGPNGGKVIATYVVEKGKPFAVPAK
jgi:quercetin dioxygenase-like cupin family protein